MIVMLRAIMLLGGLFFILLGTSFLLDPVTAAGDFGLIAEGARGLSSIRGDFTAYFWVSGGCLVWGAWARKGDPLLVVAALMGITLLGRIASLYAEGTYDGYFFPMLVEAVTVIVALIGSRILPHTVLVPDEEDQAAADAGSAPEA